MVAATKLNLALQAIRSSRRACVASLFAAAVFSLISFIAPAFARTSPGQTPASASQSQQPVLHVETDLQPLEVQVKDAQGNDVLGLSAKISPFSKMANPSRYPSSVPEMILPALSF